MPQFPTEDPISDQVLSELSLFLEFDNIASRYINTQNLAYQKIPSDKIAVYAAEMFERKTMLEALSMGTSWFLEMLDLSRGREWYIADRERLSRHAVLLALFPDSFDSQNVRAHGPLTRPLLAERKAISEDYPHLYHPRSWGEVPAEGKNLPDLQGDLDWMDHDQSGLDDDEYDVQKDEMVQLELLFEKVWGAYPVYLEESISIQEVIDRAFEDISTEGVSLPDDIAELFAARHPGSMSVLHRFVIESLIFRFMLEEGMEKTMERGEKWIAVDKTGDSPLRPISRADADRSLALMDKLLGDMQEVNDRMMDSAQAMADLSDHDSSWNLTEAVLERTEGTELWPAIALQGVMNLRIVRESDGRATVPQDLEKGEKEKDRSLTAAGLIAMTLSLHSLGRAKESDEYKKRMMDTMLSGISEPRILFLYPAAAWGCLEIGAKQEARKLASVGLKYIPEDMETELGNELLQVRRQADRVERKRKDAVVPASKRHR